MHCSIVYNTADRYRHQEPETWKQPHNKAACVHLLYGACIESQIGVSMQVTIKGFVDNMPEWMTACDMIISKAGPGTIAESFICGLPVLLNGFVPCQEEGNVPFVLKHQVGCSVQWSHF